MCTSQQDEPVYRNDTCLRSSMIILEFNYKRATQSNMDILSVHIQRRYKPKNHCTQYSIIISKQLYDAMTSIKEGTVAVQNQRAMSRYYYYTCMLMNSRFDNKAIDNTRINQVSTVFKTKAKSQIYYRATLLILYLILL